MPMSTAPLSPQRRSAASGAKPGNRLLLEPKLVAAEPESQLTPQEVKEEALGALATAQSSHTAAKLQQHGREKRRRRELQLLLGPAGGDGRGRIEVAAVAGVADEFHDAPEPAGLRRDGSTPAGLPRRRCGLGTSCTSRRGSWSQRGSRSQQRQLREREHLHVRSRLIISRKRPEQPGSIIAVVPGPVLEGQQLPESGQRRSSLWLRQRQPGREQHGASNTTSRFWRCTCANTRR